MEDSPPLIPIHDRKLSKSAGILHCLALIIFFASSCLVIFTTQIIGLPILCFSKDWYYSHIGRTKGLFGILLIAVTQFFAPQPVYISGDESVRGQMHRSRDGRLLTSFPERLIFISNHQIYTDWLFIWWISYTSKMHQAIYIILKDSLKWIPILGWGMQIYGFIFMKRKWERDQQQLSKRLSELSASRDYPTWLLLYPEGTIHAHNTAPKSAEYAKKKGIKELKYLLLPRSTGLRFCLKKLVPSIDYIYDCTIGYGGNPRGSYAEDLYTFWTIYGKGNGPSSVHIHFRRFSVCDIPFDNEALFEDWLQKRWTEKEDMLEYFYTNGHFHSDVDVVKTEVKLESPLQIFEIFSGLFALILVIFLGKRIAQEFLGLL